MRKKMVDVIPALTDGMKNILNTFSRSRIIPASLTSHASTALMAGEGFTNQKVSVQLNMRYNNVEGWHSRSPETPPHLREVQESAPDKLSDEVRGIFSDKPRPDCPCIFTQEQIMKITDLACKAPSDFGYEVGQWSPNLLAKEIHRQGITQDISAKSVSHFLERSQIKAP